jgi:CBS domain containing-hemolysin-like protein
MPALTLRTVTSQSLPIPGADPWHAAPGDPALTVMTDFRERASVTVSAVEPIDAALDHMKHAGVRSAFAVDERGRTVAGLITAYDIMGDRPLRHVQYHRSRRDAVLVRDIMTPTQELQCVDIHEVEQATVASVARMFDETGLTHVPVVETDEKGAQRLRGLLSAARVRKLLAR